MVGVDFWRNIESFPACRREALFRDRIVDCYAPRAENCAELLADSVKLKGHEEAVVCGGVRLTYSKLDGLSSAAAAALETRGIRPGDRVACLMRNSAEYVIYLFGVLKLGAVVVPLNIKESKSGIAHVLDDAAAKCAICHPELEDKISAASNKEQSFFIVLATGPDEIEAAGGEKRGPESSVEIDSEDTAFLMYTSGTTGAPKGAVITHINAVHSVINFTTAMRLGPADRSVVAVPMSHITGLVALVLSIIGASGLLVIMDDFKAADFLRLAREEMMTHTLVVPAMLSLVLLSERFKPQELSAWRVCGYGGSLMPEDVLQEVAERLPNVNLFNCYGATETTSPAAIMPAAYSRERPRQVGIPLPCARIMIADDEGREVERGTLGEIWISGPMVVRGYWNRPDANNSEFIGSYWKSGDVGFMDDAGFLSIVDRLKDVINRGGYKIYASEVEAVLRTHLAVIDCAVVSSSCTVLGERVAAFVVGSGDLDPAELKSLCAKQLAEYKVPENIVMWQELPRNANGKILKRQLREVANESFSR